MKFSHTNSNERTFFMYSLTTFVQTYTILRIHFVVRTHSFTLSMGHVTFTLYPSLLRKQIHTPDVHKGALTTTTTSIKKRAVQREGKSLTFKHIYNIFFFFSHIPTVQISASTLLLECYNSEIHRIYCVSTMIL